MSHIDSKKPPTRQACPSKEPRPAPPNGYDAIVRKLLARARRDEGSVGAGKMTKVVKSSSKSQSAAANPKQDLLVDCEIDGYRCVVARVHSSGGEAPVLSPREAEIARMVAKGLPNKVIADVIEISAHTVSTHLRSAFAKFGVKTRAALVAKMSQFGML